MSQNRANRAKSGAGRATAAKRKGGRPVPPRAKVKPATAADWIAGARLRTLPLAIAPVLIGTGASVVAIGGDTWHWVRALACLAVALLLQIGVNFANDYSDGVRGTDANRVGPSRLTGSGRANARTVLIVALAFFALAALVGLALVIRTEQWWLLIVGAAAIAAAWFYTGGKRPYGYFGLGELFVFAFFGIVATAGTTFLLAGRVNLEGWLGGVAAGFLACAVLIANNLRDIEPDRLSGKRTLTVLIGARASRVLYCVLVVLAYLIVAFFALFYPFAWLTFFTLLAAIPAALIVVTAKTSRELILALQLTSIVGLANGAFLCIAFGVSF
ncbi:1,4-dihydroxy-2-naphthoate polyprenyltransferase [Microbacterium sp. STN6]|uniref:1,4-dihydroxy-2-naphthoate polyprenyltransferase n=1 Tax=Microbacterium sp. STN6 TaxID=2995588 RepID=UPI002260F1CB|nr:1,4-dihydroxy-2-naphthoate polyprenyltransferase [Microbacterium sp. STN6]MCX7520687.1 1,4-dihydroxy-2-naphthoate polyprenyltransferase [Microbacterium sp. STN6]